MYHIGKPDALSVNGLRFECDENGYELVFSSIESAEKYLLKSGISKDAMDERGIRIVKEEN